ncbi:aminodeoxychorismate/anthranilate synthase component II [Microbispora amethystogenes]|uniref:anthranilate synthase component II n=1 Tax=Microbispora amethystogenes TaxID=1427754 RepID=UPI0033F9AB40
MTTLVVDAYDSFVHTVALYLAELGAEPLVRRHDTVTAETVEALAPDAIVLGPGPGHPASVGYVELIRRFAGRIPIMGVCLGHQAVALAFGGTVTRASHLMHGKTSRIEHDGQGCFAGLAQDLEATRYHSLIVTREDLPEVLRVTATDADDGYVMGLRHREHAVESVQFHPESHRTAGGMAIFANFYAQYVRAEAEVS